MIEILWHGRGGQGAFTAARLLGAAASDGKKRFALAFPSFGPERRGAPMRAFTKVDSVPIGDRSAVSKADYVIYLDETLLGSAWESELKPTGRVLVNSVRNFSDERIVALDADRISEEEFGRAVPNAVFLGALCALEEGFDVGAMKEAVRLYLPRRLHEGNGRIVDVAYAQVKLTLDAAASGSAPVGAIAGAGIGASGSSPEVGRAKDSSDAARLSALPEDTAAVKSDEAAADPARTAAETAARRATPHTVGERRAAHIPALVRANLDPAQYARSTCFAAGHLVDTNAGWRSVRPVIDEAACTGCLQCYLHCPDGTIFKVARASNAEGARTGREGDSVASRRAASADVVAVDYDFCKGCGICANVCRFKAVAMVHETEARIAEAARSQAEGELR